MPRRKAVSLYDLLRGKKDCTHCEKYNQSLFPCLGEGTHVNYSKISPSLSDVKV